MIPLLLLSAALCQSVPAPKLMPEPALPFEDPKACPFEGCAYRQWTAQKEVAVYDTWKPSRREIAKIATGEKVTGVTGVVVTMKPGVIRLDRDLPMQHFRAGDLILTYAYRGEGFSAVWFKGAYYSDFDISFAKRPDGTGCGGDHCAATYLDLGEKEWWAQVKLSSGQTGWVHMDMSNFEGIDMLAGD
jgi:hypothetical protein